MVVGGRLGVPKWAESQAMKEFEVSKAEALTPMEGIRRYVKNHDSRLFEDFEEQRRLLKNVARINDTKIFVDNRAVRMTEAKALIIVAVLLYALLFLATYIAFTKGWLN